MNFSYLLQINRQMQHIFLTKGEVDGAE